MLSVPVLHLLAVWILGYVEFGLSIFAVSGVLCVAHLTWSRREHVSWVPDALQIMASLICLFLLDGYRAIWDGSHAERFPLWLSFSMLTVLYCVVGKASYRIRKKHEQNNEKLPQ
jgi:hypothetical protein